MKSLARDCGFDLAGIAPAIPIADYARFDRWRSEGMAGEMTYLTDRRGDLRTDPRNLLPSARSILCVGKLYNTSAPPSTGVEDGLGWIARYAWGRDYHETMRLDLERFVCHLQAELDEQFEWRICIDTAPLLERSLARLAGLGWIGKNTCLINQESGSWFLLGEILLSLAIEPDVPPPERCGTCRRCVDACPTDALVPDGKGWFTLDSKLCISYLTIERRGELPETVEPQMGHQVFGCDICQDVCPWNKRAPAMENEFSEWFAPSLIELSNLNAEDFRLRYKTSAVWRAKYAGFLRNVAIAMGNSNQTNVLEPLVRLTMHADETVAHTAARALSRAEKRVAK